MKRILVLLITLSLLFTLASCGKDEDGLEIINKAFSASEPTMSVTTDTQIYGSITLNGKYTLIIGKIDGKSATQYIANYDKIDTIENGSGTVITGPVTNVTETKEYVDGRGLRENGGKWKDEDDFAPSKGDISLNLTSETVTEYTFENNVFTCVISPDNTEAVFGVGNAIAAEVNLVIKTDGVVITEINISYELEAQGEYPAVSVTTNTVYSYDIQSITLVK